MSQCIQTGVLKDAGLDKRDGHAGLWVVSPEGGPCCLMVPLGWHLVLHRVLGPGLWGGLAPAMPSHPSLPQLPLLQTQPESSTCRL